jgi:hypothetical protein
MFVDGILIIFGLLLVALLLVGAVYLLRRWNSPDGERYMRMRMQGPFVPLSEEDVAADRRRRKRGHN